MKKLLSALIIICNLAPYAAANQYYPEFDKMKTMRCDIVETTFDANNKEIAVTGYFRIFRLDDENKLLYLQKNFINNLTAYDDEKITFNDETLTDNSIIRIQAQIDRKQMKYTSSSYIEYDDSNFGEQKSVGIGECKYI